MNKDSGGTILSERQPQAVSLLLDIFVSERALPLHYIMSFFTCYKSRCLRSAVSILCYPFLNTCKKVAYGRLDSEK
jgi:hypothetical protein